LGIGEAFTEGRDEKDWVDYCLSEFRRLRFPELPTLEEFIEENIGAWTRPATRPAIAFEDFRRDPETYPLKTPSGKIEIFSKQLFDLGSRDEIPPIPKYIQEWESPFSRCHCEEGREASRRSNPLDASEVHLTGNSSHDEIASPPTASRNDMYPLQAIGHHTLHRVHSTHDNNDWLEEAFPQRVFINPIDAEPRGIRDGDEVKVFNDRGALILPCRITHRILPGVVDIPQGAWYEPDENGIDRGGCVNVLTSHHWTPFAYGTAQHTIMVQVEIYRSKVVGPTPNLKPSTFDPSTRPIGQSGQRFRRNSK
jgi:anaerobic dimethyl sulfoxide reductase subunit A